MRKAAICLLWIWMALALTPGLQAQCTGSPEVTAEALAAMLGAVDAVWPLDVPRETQIDSYDGFKGALLVAGPSVYQIESIRWRITDQGALDVQELVAHTRDGVSTHVTRNAGGKPIDSLSNLGGFFFGNPAEKSRRIQVDDLRFATDRDGFLTIGEMKGFDLETGAQIVLPPGTPLPPVEVKCGLRVTMGCNSHDCNGGACGAAPGCPCNGKSGSCEGHSESICSGSCPDGMVCNGSVQDCKCIAKPTTPPSR